MADQPKEVSVNFHMLKSNYFRVVHADGAWGGITPRGLIAYSFYNERGAIPRQTQATLTSTDGVSFAAAGPEQVVDGRDGVVRELEVEVIMDFAAAQEFHKWLGEKLAERAKVQG